ncbi:MAG TPA: thioesterase family protein [Azospirillum sp.]|nr:thioesterase family protein [Azospirillum sp.]
MQRLVMTRTVKWGDCDPAGIIYTPRVFDYMTEAVEAWFRDVGGIDWVMMIHEHRMGAPTVHTSVDFLTPMEPNLVLHVAVLVETVGRSSLTFRIVGDDDAGTRYFEGKLISVITDFRERRSVPIPDAVRKRAEAYRRLAAPVV